MSTTTKTQEFEITEEDDRILCYNGFRINYEQKSNAVLGYGMFGRVLKGTCLGHAIRKVYYGNRSIEVSLSGKACAISQLSIEFNCDKRTNAKYTKAKMLMGMNHPNLMSVYAVFQTPHNTFFIMEYINGTNLDAFTQKYSISQEVTIDILKQLVSGIEYLHRMETIHCDLKGNNIILYFENKQVHIKIVGLGNAKKLKNENQVLDLKRLGQNLLKLLSVTTNSDHNLEKSLQGFAEMLKEGQIYTDINQVMAQMNRILENRCPQPSHSSFDAIISNLFKRKSIPFVLKAKK